MKIQNTTLILGIAFILAMLFTNSAQAQLLPAPTGSGNGVRYNLPVNKQTGYSQDQPVSIKMTQKKVTLEIPTGIGGNFDLDVFEVSVFEEVITDAAIKLANPGNVDIKNGDGTTTRMFIYVITVITNQATYSFIYQYTSLDHDNSVRDGKQTKITERRTDELKGYNPNETLVGVKGDAMYVITPSMCWVTKDTGNTWQLDTIGFNGSTLYSLSLDSAQNVYLATTGGLLKQALTSQQWNSVPSYSNIVGKGSCRTVFVDRKERIFAAGNGMFYMSTDQGNSFKIDTAGIGTINGMTPQVISICDDDLGNIYVITGSYFFSTLGSAILKSTGGTQPFVRIDQNLKFLYKYNNTDQMYKNFSADSKLIVASTAYGFFSSTDAGATWKEYNSAPTNICFGFVKTPQGRFITSTELGVFIKNPGDTVWTKTLPTDGYFAAGRIYRTNSGTIYTTGGNNQLGNTSNLLWKSTDSGSTWVIDTVGYSGLNTYTFYVDELGNMYAGTIDFSTPSKIYTRPAGGSWKLDVNGFTTATGQYIICISSDKKGSIYAALYTTTLTPNYPSLYKRPINGTNWTPDSAGIQGNDIYDLTAQSDGTLWAGTYSGLYKKTVGGTWYRIGNLPGQAASFVSVDGSNAVWTQCSN
ncbi:MAG: hypothetical protein ABSG15_06200, partial [FCB group bacterium]